MTPKRLILDSDIVIYLLKKQQPFVNHFLRLLETKTVFLLSTVVVAEIYAGAFEREYMAIETLFGFCEHIDVDTEIGRLAGQYAYRYRKAYQGISLEGLLAGSHCKETPMPFMDL